MTSPSIGARKVTACDTSPAPRRKSRARSRVRAASAAARSRAAWAASRSRCAPACASNSSRWRRSSRSVACRSASALRTSDDGSLQLEEADPEIVQVLEVLGADLGEGALRVEKLEQPRGALLVLDARQVARALGTFEQPAPHAIYQLAVRGERPERSGDVVRE